MDIIHMSYMRFKFPQLGLIGLMVGAKDLYHRDSGFKSGFKLLGLRILGKAHKSCKLPTSQKLVNLES